MNYLEAQKFAATHLCAVCGNYPSAYPDPADPDRGYQVRCQHPEHQGFDRIPSYTEMWKSGSVLPLHIANQIENKFGGQRMETTALVKLERAEMERRLNIAAGSFGFVVEETGISRGLNPAEMALLIDYCLTYGFDPLLHEVCLYHGSPYPQIDGLRRKAQETKQYRGLKLEPVIDGDIKKAVGYQPDDIVFKATVRRADEGGISEFERYGGVGQWEITEKSKKDPERLRYPVVAKRASDMAQNRAERDALRAAFQFNFPGIENLPLVIEGEFREVDKDTGELIGPEVAKSAAAKPQPKAKNGQPPAQPPAPITQPQVTKLWIEWRAKGYDEPQLRSVLKHRYHVESLKALTQAQASELISDTLSGEDVLAEIATADPGQETLGG